MAGQESWSDAVTDLATPNLPSRDFDLTSRFYRALGFAEGWRDEGWMILERGPLMFEFFAHPQLDPATSWFSCCLRMDDLDGFFAVCKATGIPEAKQGVPRLQAPRLEASGIRIGYLVDPDGTLVRLIQN